jgi:hypothetical protein
MTLAKKSNHRDEALRQLAQQFQGKPRLQALLEAFLTQVQALEDALFSVLEETPISTAVGAQLDGLGSIVGEAREGRADPDYRIAILARIRINLSSGTPEDIIALIRAVLGPVTVKLTEYFPADFIAEVLGPIDPLAVNPAQVGAFVRSGRPAGVGSGVVFHVTPEFRFDSTVGHGFDAGKYAGVF